MLSVTVFAWVAVGVGVFLGSMLGQRAAGRHGFGRVAELAIAGVLLGVSLSVATTFVDQICLKIGVCAPTTEASSWSVIYPLMLIPAYWIAMFLGVVFPSRSLQPENLLDGAGTAAIVSALAKFRAGNTISETCPTCKSLLKVKPAKLKPSRDSGALSLTCECGASNGTYEVESARA